MPLSTLTLALGLVGSLLAPLTLRPAQFVSLLLVGAFLGSFAGLLARSVREDHGLDTQEALVEAFRNAVVGAVWAVAVGMLVFILGGYGWVVSAALLAAYPLLRWLLPRLPRTRSLAAVTADATADVAAEADARLSTPPFEKCSTSELAAAWGASYDLLQATSSPRVKARIVALRGAYLDELERRDRHGVRRWLTSGADPASDAGHYFPSQDEGGERRPEVG